MTNIESFANFQDFFGTPLRTGDTVAVSAYSNNARELRAGVILGVTEDKLLVRLLPSRRITELSPKQTAERVVIRWNKGINS